ncbi:aromatic-ring hydroxylase C-terminal domain-containing protein [Streptomyces sp. NPDC002346]
MNELSVTGGRDVHTVRFPVAAPPTTGERLRQDHVNAVGVAFDERYDASTVIRYAPGQLDSEPAWRADVYENDPRPAHQAPDGHVDPYGGTLYDRIGNSFALPVLTKDRLVEHALVAEAAARSLPFTVIHLSDPGAHAVYGTTNVLVRPDQHVAWRGAVLPDQGAGAALDRVLGRAHAGAATTDLVAAGTAGA